MPPRTISWGLAVLPKACGLQNDSLASPNSSLERPTPEPLNQNFWGYAFLWKLPGWIWYRGPYLLRPSEAFILCTLVLPPRDGRREPSEMLWSSLGPTVFPSLERVSRVVTKAFSWTLLLLFCTDSQSLPSTCYRFVCLWMVLTTVDRLDSFHFCFGVADLLWVFVFGLFCSRRFYNPGPPFTEVCFMFIILLNWLFRNLFISQHLIICYYNNVKTLMKMLWE